MKLFNKKELNLIQEKLFRKADLDDPTAIDYEIVNLLTPKINWFCDKYFRQEVIGLSNIPKGKALLVGNHNSGISFFEFFGFGARYFMEFGEERPINGLAHDAIMQIPFLGPFLNSMGAVRASQKNADHIFDLDRKVIVFPGGNLEAYRSYKQRHEINFGDRKGFIKLALRNKVPIVPIVFIGGHEGFYVINDGQKLAKLLGLDRIPILRSDTWPLMFSFPWGLTLGPIFHIPLPTKCITKVLTPISLDSYSQSDIHNEEALNEIYFKVTERMQRELRKLSRQRTLPILG